MGDLIPNGIKFINPLLDLTSGAAPWCSGQAYGTLDPVTGVRIPAGLPNPRLQSNFFTLLLLITISNFSKVMTMIRLISFDVWNTLLDINVMIENLVKALSELLKVPEEEIAEKTIKTREEIKKIRKSRSGDPEKALEESQELLARALEVDVEIVKRAVAKATLSVDERIVLPEVKETLKKLHGKYIITTTGNVMFWPSTYTRLILEKFGLADYITKQFYSDEIKAYKPMKEAFLAPLRYFNVPPEEAIHIGDTKAEDFEGALNTGMHACWIDPETEKVEQIHEKGFVVKNTKDLLEVLQCF
ncbi:Hydrolase, HAD superfamily [Thermococcus sibiricus MM 739]|uniref:Hydrolase, HAD superfamily n=3 Tax=Thermococcaceae TaxID=2259 RepID=C6A4U2_THESM|nr:Hydrolase, HAD superfamily [Thermococcus sibiricus MM 739]